MGSERMDGVEFETLASRADGPFGRTVATEARRARANEERLAEALGKAFRALEGGFSKDPAKRPETPELWVEMCWAAIDEARAALKEAGFAP